jgi:hypothetical protein
VAISPLLPTRTTPEARAKFPLLVSYALVRDKPEALRMFLDHPGVELLLDSGAFTALNTGQEIRLDDYMKFLDKWQDKLFGYLALDKLGDPKQTDENLVRHRLRGRELHRSRGAAAAVRRGGRVRAAGGTHRR